MNIHLYRCILGCNLIISGASLVTWLFKKQWGHYIGRFCQNDSPGAWNKKKKKVRNTLDTKKRTAFTTKIVTSVFITVNKHHADVKTVCSIFCLMSSCDLWTWIINDPRVTILKNCHLIHLCSCFLFFFSWIWRCSKIVTARRAKSTLRPDK